MDKNHNENVEQMMEDALEYWITGSNIGFGEVWAIHMRAICKELAKRDLMLAFTHKVSEYEIAKVRQ